jgi:hypothetical protein
MKTSTILLLLVPSILLAQPRFDTGNKHEDKYWVGTALTLGGITMINHAEGPIEAIGAVWAIGGVANLASAEIESEYRGYYPSDVSWKEEVLPCLSMFVAGAFNGVNQDLLFHYHEFENTFPNASRQFWDPSISWRNKYMNGDPSQGEAFPGSSTIFASVTDGYHATVAARNIMLTTTVCLSPKTKGWKPFVKRTLMYSAFYGLGFEIVYGKLIK